MDNNIIIRFNEIGSTSDEARKLALSGAPHGTIIIAETQTGGRGRGRKKFFSPRGGIYFSILLHADKMKITGAAPATIFAAVLVCEAIEKICGFEVSVKWVNDILLNEKKVCGILAESVNDAIIMGIGINFETRPEDFPKEIKSTAGSLYPSGAPCGAKEELIGEIINAFLRSDPRGDAEIFREYKKRLSMLGAQIIVTAGKETFAATALDVDADGALVVGTDFGETRRLISGEVTVAGPR